MFVLTVATCVTVTSLALAIVVVHSLKFAKWAIEREDRINARYEPITSAIFKMKHDTLLSQRGLHEARHKLLLNSGHDTAAKEHEKEIARLDGEMLVLARTEVIDDA